MTAPGGRSSLTASPSNVSAALGGSLARKPPRVPPFRSASSPPGLFVPIPSPKHHRDDDRRNGCIVGGPCPLPPDGGPAATPLGRDHASAEPQTAARARHDGKIVPESCAEPRLRRTRHSLEGAHMPLESLEDAALDRLS